MELILGGIFILLGTLALFSQIYYSKKYIKTIAEVTFIEEGYHLNSSTTDSETVFDGAGRELYYEPTVRLITKDGKEVIHKFEKFSQISTDCTVGDKLEVYYLVSKPDIVILSVGKLWFLSIGFLIIGVVLCLIGK